MALYFSDVFSVFFISLKILSISFVALTILHLIGLYSASNKFWLNFLSGTVLYFTIFIVLFTSLYRFTSLEQVTFLVFGTSRDPLTVSV